MQFSLLVLVSIVILVAIVVYLIRKAPESNAYAVPDSGNPTDEADLRMAYGQYKEAKALIDVALDAEPDRIDLQMKLLEICFVWGNEAEFVAAARKYEANLREAGEWDKVEIMGRQVASNDFS